MSRSVNKVILVGNLGRDAETKYTAGGAAVTNFSVATERQWKDKQSGETKKETDWHNCTLWQSENLAQYLTKGTKLYVEGRLQTRKYDKDGQTHYATDVICSEVVLLGGRDSGGSERSEEPVSRPRQQAAQREAEPFVADDDSLPF